MAVRDVQIAAEAFVPGFLAELATKQAAYLTRTGRYWQGLISHAIRPAEGVPLAPDRTRRPTDQVETWLGEGYTLPALMAFAVSVHTYSGTHGQGYEVVTEFGFGGLAHVRTWQVGPETHRVSGWGSYDPLALPGS